MHSKRDDRESETKLDTLDGSVTPEETEKESTKNPGDDILKRILETPPKPRPANKD